MNVTTTNEFSLKTGIPEIDYKHFFHLKNTSKFVDRSAFPFEFSGDISTTFIVFITLLHLEAIWILLANFLIILATATHRELQNASGILFLSLAFADIMVAFYATPDMLGYWYQN